MSLSPIGRCLHVVGCIAWVAFAWFGCSRPFSEVDQVIDRNTKAMGGRAAIAAINSIEISLHIVDPGFEVDGVYRAARPGRMRIDVMAGGSHVFTEAFNGERGWQWKGKGDPVDESPPATAALRHGVELPGKLFGLHELRERGHQIRLAGRETLDGIEYFALEVRLSDGYVTSLYVDPKTWLVTRRRDVRPLHVDIDPTPTTIEARSSDFRSVSGVMFPFASADVDVGTGKVLESATVREIKLNPTFDQTSFDKL
jgi:hypothetical protein